jgi:hypothetical protein
VGVDSSEALIVQAKLFNRQRRVILNQDVALFYQLQKNFSPRGSGEVKGNPQLVGIEVKEETAPLWVGYILDEGSPPPRLIAYPGRLDFYYLGSQVCQELGAVGAGGKLRILQDLYPVEGRIAYFLFPLDRTSSGHHPGIIVVTISLCFIFITYSEPVGKHHLYWTSLTSIVSSLAASR